MRLPANSDSSAAVKAVTSDVLHALQAFGVEALLVLGPDPFGTPSDRQVLLAHPASLLETAQALARSQDFSVLWCDGNPSLLAWLDLTAAPSTPETAWRQWGRAQLYHGVFRIAFPIVASRAFEFYCFSHRPWSDPQVRTSLPGAILTLWPGLLRAVTQACSPLSPRELACLKQAFSGMTARATGEFLSCSERTVNFHLANAMGKLQVTSKLAAVQRACWLGLI